MKNLKKIAIGFTLLLVLPFTVNAQDTTSTFDRQAAQNNPTNYDSKPGKSKMMLRGYYHTGFENTTIGDESNSKFTPGSIAPILMYRQNDKLFFEAEFEGAFEDGEFEWTIEYADISYILNDYMTVRAGKFMLPFGTFMEKLHPAWINRLSTKPLGFGHDGIAPGNDVGAEVRGAFYTGPIKLNYQAYVVNGAQLKDGITGMGGMEVEEDEAGMLNFENGVWGDNNNDKAFGGRLGIFPFTNSSLELGFSGYSAKVGGKDTPYEDVRANLYALDLSFVRNLNFIKSVIDIKGQYMFSQVDDANYAIPEDTLGLYYDFNNVSSAYYAQVSLRPSLSGNKFLSRLEAVGRYSIMETPEGSLWESNPTQIAVGLNYWLDWRTVLKFGYQTTDGVGGHSEEPAGAEEMATPSTDLFYIHLAIGF
tara:strand:- start:232 stop:1491 length:1260 start_codon:yes stop_codon:yes gene_type:complete